MSETATNVEPPGTAGSAPVCWEDKPNRHAYCDAEIRRLRGALERTSANPAAVPVPLDDLAAAGLLAERAQDALAQLQAENEHLKSALAGDNEGVRLWMLDCARLVNRHRERGDRAEAALAGAAKAERERIRCLFDEWVTLAMSEPNSHPPEAWKIAFADLISDKPQFPLARAGTCGQCDGGLIRIGRCNCGSPADASIGYAHERLCGYEPCPNGCWDRLHPATGSPS